LKTTGTHLATTRSGLSTTSVTPTSTGYYSAL
jgi:hypothetical protein